MYRELIDNDQLAVDMGGAYTSDFEAHLTYIERVRACYAKDKHPDPDHDSNRAGKMKPKVVFV